MNSPKLQVPKPAPPQPALLAGEQQFQQSVSASAAESPVMRGAFAAPGVMQGAFANPMIQRGNLPAPGVMGTGLPATVQGQMENTLGADFSRVQFKKDSVQATEMGALAYTQGEEVHFAPGQYDPNSQQGQKLIGHELTHVVQQRAGRVQATTQMKGVAVNTDAGLEKEADSFGEKAVGATQMKAAPVQTGSTVQTKGPIQRVVDYDALAKAVKAELDSYFPGSAAIMVIMDQIPMPGGFQQLGNAYNLISKTPLVMDMRAKLSEVEYMQVMEKATGIKGSVDTIRANTTESKYNLRAEPNETSKIIGQLDFSEMRVTVSGKATIGDEVFYRAQFNADDYARITAAYKPSVDAPSLASKHQAWITDAAFNTYVSWEQLISQLEIYDIMTYDKTVKEKITMLRQMSHSSDLPFDEVIGTKGGSYYQSDRVNHYDVYQLMRESQAVQTPNGEIVDIYHFIVGLDAFQSARQNNARSVSGLGGLMTLNSDIGKSDAAATWSGDLGAAAADCLLKESKEYEKHVAAAGPVIQADRVDYYFRTRASSADLLADIDAWGAVGEVDSGEAVTITELIRNYYGTQMVSKGAFNNKRKASLQAFASRYGLVANSNGTYDSPANQTVLAIQIYKFALVWLQNREGLAFPFSSHDFPLLRGYSDAMAVKFLQLIDDIATR